MQVQVSYSTLQCFLAEPSAILFLVTFSDLVLSRHLAAFISAFTAFISALFAMRILKFTTLGTASITDGCTKATYLLGIRTIPRHKSSGHRTNIDAVPKQIDTIYSGLYVRFFQAGSKAFFAYLHTFVTSVNACLILLHS